MNIVNIAGREIGPNKPCFIVAEIGINHNGSVELAKKLIDAAVLAGADAVKFQTRDVHTVYSSDELSRPRPAPREILEHAVHRGVLSKETTDRLTSSDFQNSTNGDLKQLLEFTDAEYEEIDEYCKKHSILWSTSAWDTKSFLRMQQFRLPFHKIASACNEDDSLLQLIRDSHKPIILSTGMSDLAGVREAVRIVGTENLVLMQCTSVYPSVTGDPKETLPKVNLRGIETLRQEFDVPVGFSSHVHGIMPIYASVAMGAMAIEVHVTLDRGTFGSDQGSSLESGEFIRLCRAIRELPLACGSGEKVIHPEELDVAKKLRRVRRKRTESVSTLAV